MADLEFYTNGFVIIDLVPEGELQTGKILEDKILDLTLYEEKKEIFCKREKCANVEELTAVLEGIKTHIVNTGEVPIIHIEGHASKESLKLLDGSLLPWKTVFSYFREINILSRNNLFFMCGACESAYALKTNISIKTACPVFALLAPEKKVKAGEMSDGFLEFYQHYIRTGNVGEAFHAFADRTDAIQYALIFSHHLFKKVAKKHITENCIGKNRKQRVEKALTEVIKETNAPVNQARKVVKEMYYEPQGERLNKYYREFMMVDICPENKERFQFDAVQFEEKIRSGEVKPD